MKKHVSVKASSNLKNLSDIINEAVKTVKESKIEEYKKNFFNECTSALKKYSSSSGSLETVKEVMENIYKTIELLHNSQIEIFVPQRHKLTDSMKKALSDIRKRKGEDVIKCREYNGAQRLAALLASPTSKNVKRIVIADNRDYSQIRGLVDTQPEIFMGVRLMNAILPDDYENLEDVERTLYQAKMINIAILERLFEKNETPMVEALLRNMLKGCVEGIDDYIANIAESDGEAKDPNRIKMRILFCLSKAVSFVEKIGQEIRLMKAFWTAA